MASSLESSSIVRDAVGSPPRDARLVECDKFIEGQLSATRGQVKGVEIATSLLKLLVGLIAYFLLLVVVDHWVLPGGLGFWTRLLALIGLLAAGGWYLTARVFPLFGKRVNPVYAAYSIEKTQPTLKNSVINFLLLRRERQHVAEPVYVAIEQRAASDLQRVPVEAAVDRSGLIRLGYVLVGLVTIVCAYWLLSPKDPWRTFRRVAAPWADVAPATRVAIDAIEPGSTRVFQGERVRVVARVRGVRSGEEVTLLWSTADGQNVDQPIAMQPSAEGYASFYEAELPGGSGTLQQNTEYYVRAGDAESPRFVLEVVTAPAILVDRVEYAYPAYADVPNRVVERQGDLQGIDGTTVTITARANVPIKSAYIDFDADGGRDVALLLNGQTAVGRFKLSLDKQGESEHKNYQVRFLDNAGHENPYPVRHTIEVLPDQPPAIEFTEPGRDEVELPLNGALTMALRAADRDFKLRRVTVFFEKKGGAKLRSEVLLDEPRAGRFDGALVFDASTLEPGKVAAGDTIEYWAEARDNRHPVANEAHTVKHRIRLTSPVDEVERQRQLAEAEKKAEEAVAADTDEAVAGESPAEGDEHAGDESDVASAEGHEAGEPSSPEADRKDPEREAAEAMEDILAYRDEHAEDPPRDDSQPREDQPREDSPEEQSAAQQQDEQQQGGDEQSGDQQGGESSESGGQSEEQSGGEQSGGQQGGASGQGEGQPKPDGGSGESSTEQPSGGQAGKPRAGRKPGGSGDAAAQPDNASPDSGATEQPNGGSQPAGRKPGDRKPAGKQPKPQPGDSPEGGEQDTTAPNDASQPGENSKPKPGGRKPNKPESTSQPGGEQDGSEASGQDEASDAGSEGGSSRPGDQAGESSERNAGANPTEGGASDQQGAKPPRGRKPPQQASPQEGGDPATEQADAQGDQPEKPKPDGDGESPAASEPQRQDDPGEQGSGSGAGDRAAPKAGPQRDKPQSDEERHDEEATGGDPNNSTGEGGAGQQPENHKPSGRIDQQQGTKNKNEQGPSDSDPSNDDVGDNASSPKPHESDSQGAESGDRQGGGQQGGGQKANKPGTGSAGENTAADQGSGQAPGAGDGDASDQAGNKTPGQQPRQGSGEKTDGAGASGESSKPEGDSGSPSSSGQPGEGGSGNKPRQSGDQPHQPKPNSGDRQPQPQGDDSSTPEGADQAADQQPGQPDADTGGNSGGSGQPNGAGINTGAGQPQGPNQTGAPPQEALGGEEANAEYAKKQTDLVIESLKDQLANDQLDPELLKKLGWSREDVEKFVNKWEALRKAAGQEGPEGDEAREQYDRVINDLNLKRRGVSIRQSAKPDQVNRLRESRGSKPPAEYADQFRAYTEGATKATAPRGK
ncbi:MAG: hypothetical protein AB7O68_17845 [Pirellulales bacterium]